MMNNGDRYRKMGFWKMLGTRCGELVGKIISLKFLLFGIAIVLTRFKIMESWQLFAYGVALISIKSFEKYVASK